MKLTVANVLTLARLVIAPLFVWLFLADVKAWAFAAFSFAAFTDLIDGTIARMLGQFSKWGALVDPMADKLLMQSCFILLLVYGYIPMWFFAMALTRDIMIVSGIIYLEVKKAKLPYKAIWPSKLATLVQMAIAVAALMRWAWPKMPASSGWLVPCQTALMAVAAILIVVSGFQYLQIGLGILRDHGRRAISA